MNFETLLPPGMPLQDAITWLSAFSAFVCVLTVWKAALTPKPMVGRVKRIQQRRAELQAGWKSSKRSQDRRIQAMSLMRKVTERFKFLKSQTTTHVTQKLARAGWRGRDAMVTYLFMKLCLPFVFGGGAFFLFFVLKFGDLPDPLPMFAPVFAMGLGVYAPDVFVKNAITKREVILQKSLPDALDLLVICAEAGLSLDASLNRVSNEMAAGSPEIAEEFGLTSVELGFMPERRQALDNLAKRCQVSSIQSVINTLLQTEKYGTPLANSLRVLSSEFRDERMMKAEEKAARLPAIMTVPMILFIMPALLIVLNGPAMLKILDTLSSM
jgi:tight adherence protein C